MKKTTNVHFLRKMASDELRETLFFCTGIRPIKERTSGYTSLKCGDIEVKVNHTRSIKINGDQCRSVWEAKFVIGQLAGLDPI